jgi:succinate dehydrogenase / fumarate reductase cytochrome b subunit
MEPSPRSPNLSNVSRWFAFRGRKAGTFAFILNRVTAVGLTFYLFLHLIVLGKLAQGPEAFNGFVEIVESPIYILGELLVVAAGFFHGLNGLRVIANSFGLAIPYQRHLFYFIILLTTLITAVFGIRMFTA